MVVNLEPICKWRHLVAKFATNSSGAIYWPTLQLVQVVSSAGLICEWCHLMAKFETNVNVVMWLLCHGANFGVHCASGNIFLDFCAAVYFSLILSKVLSSVVNG